MAWTAYIGLGSNLGDRESYLIRAQTAFLKHPQIVFEARSKIRSSRALLLHADSEPQPDFLNAVVRIKTDLEPEALLQELLRIERENGRVREQKWGARTLDLDLVYGTRDGLEVRVQSECLTLPHPGVFERDFVIAPLLELVREPSNEVLAAAAKWHGQRPESGDRNFR